MTRFDCMHMAAWHVSRAEFMTYMGARLTADEHLADAREWRRIGKALPRRIGMVCARARRRQRMRVAHGRVKARNLMYAFEWADA